MKKSVAPMKKAMKPAAVTIPTALVKKMEAKKTEKVPTTKAVASPKKKAFPKKKDC